MEDVTDTVAGVQRALSAILPDFYEFLEREACRQTLLSLRVTSPIGRYTNSPACLLNDLLWPLEGMLRSSADYLCEWSKLLDVPPDPQSPESVKQIGEIMRHLLSI